jgi:hypothetical protein
MMYSASRFSNTLRYLSNRVLLIDGDQNMTCNNVERGMVYFFDSIHVFRNSVSEKNQRLKNPDSLWCKYHTTPCQKEAVDHSITFFCGQNSQTWLANNKETDVTIISRDKGFQNTKWLLENVGVKCEVLPQFPFIRKGNKLYL